MKKIGIFKSNSLQSNIPDLVSNHRLFSFFKIKKKKIKIKFTIDIPPVIFSGSYIKCYSPYYTTSRFGFDNTHTKKVSFSNQQLCNTKYGHSFCVVFEPRREENV